jgi:pimeloyl-ACP methyl ester carboxylesterase
VPGAKYVKLPYGGHFVPTVAPDSFNKPLRDFLRAA